MELRHLRYFVAVAEELHFGRAATRLSIMQPSLSQQIQQLEDELGFPLFRRTKRSVELTDAGSVFLDAARKVLLQVQEAKQAAQRAHRGEAGRLVIGYISSSTYDVLPLMLRLFRERFPQVEVALRELTTHEQLRALEEGAIQIGLIRLPINAPWVSVQVVRREPIVCVLPERHPLAAHERIPGTLLAQEPFVLQSRQQGSGYHVYLMKLCLGYGFTPNVVQEVTQMHAIVGMVAAGIGVSLVPLSTQNIRSQGVVYRELEGEAPITEVAVAWRSDAHSRLIQNFLSVAREATPDLH
ncbi:LysR family transcriptional regulator [Ktedonobacter racemifer]|uniref:Transcriptional regulator, LysR family n=1 Tax=Ktedonobacter racemifer DSM 44963 TaxID=485913 RepID=D6U197_KTERA|nr:LysR family transcriptional regulator [Ktedonobacter racemifer]EFH82587.1 transcriptional regulator, LysR family [Ktedonobacter racemifer DSM 44963]